MIEIQEKYWKQYIYCSVEDSKISKIIELLKPENQKDNIYVFWKANFFSDWKIDKIIINDVSYDENFDQHNQSLF